jgi:hypothetical protein
VVRRGSYRAGRASPPENKLQLELDYASGWFQYTASQRLTTFNFFLVVVGLLLVAYAQAIDHSWRLFGAAIGFIGAIVSLGFLIIDVRNEVLVNKGLSALRELEAELKIALADPDLDRKHLRKVLDGSRIGRCVARFVFKGLGSKDGLRSERRERVFRYRFWFRVVISVVGVSFFLGSFWAAFGFRTTKHPETVACRASTVLTLHRPGFDLSLVRRSEREGEQRGADDDRGRPDDRLSGDLHVESVGMGDYKRVQTGRHCGKEAVGGG